MKYELDNIYNEDCYKAIKKIPDKSIDLVYIDIPYLIENGGLGKNVSPITLRIASKCVELGANNVEMLKKKADELKQKMDQAKTKEEYEKYHCLRGNVLNKINLKSADIANGIDYSIFDELCRVMKHIYIYIYGVAKNKYLI